MTRYMPFAVAGVLLAGLAGGCIGQAGTSIGGREITATAAPLRGVGVCTYDDGATARFALAARVIEVNERQISWSDEEQDAIELPADWKTLELNESGRRIVVRVDGKHFGRIE